MWDVQSKLQQVLDDGTQYIYGARLVSQVTASGTVYYLGDGLGSTVAIVDSSGTVVQSYSYDVYGAVKSSSGSQASDVQFAGQQTDPNGLQYLRARYYDASTGCFLSRDPLHSAEPTRFPAYRYGSNNPASNTDPSGLDSAPPGRPLTGPPPFESPIPPAPGFGHCVNGYVCLAFQTPSGPVWINFNPVEFNDPARYADLIAAAQAMALAISDRSQDIASGAYGFAAGLPLRGWGFFVVASELGFLGKPCVGGAACTSYQNNTIWININNTSDPYGIASHEIGHIVFGGAHCDWDTPGGPTHVCYPGPNGSRCFPTPGQGVAGPPPD